jgi:hypothetical protein
MLSNEMTISDLFPSRYLRTSDVGENDLVLTIEGVTFEVLGDKKETKPVVSFKETPKVLVLNKTNGNTLAHLYGPKVANWRDKKIALYTTEVSFQGAPMLGIRVRMRPPAQSQMSQPSNPESPEDQPDPWA